MKPRTAASRSPINRSRGVTKGRPASPKTETLVPALALPGYSRCQVRGGFEHRSCPI